jgi:hypothetical protein
MQDVQNIPNPDVNIIEDDGDFGSHSGSDAPNTDADEREDNIPTAPDRAPNVPIEEPPDEEGEAGETERIV